MGKVGTGIGIGLGLLAVAGGATIGGLHIDKQNKDIKAKSAEIVSYQEGLQNSNEHIILLQNGNKEYEKQLAQKDEQLAEKDQELAGKDAEIAEKDLLISQQIQQLGVNNLDLESKRAIIAEQSQALAEKDEIIASKNAELEEKNQQIEELESTNDVEYTTKEIITLHLQSPNESLTCKVIDSMSDVFTASAETLNSYINYEDTTPSITTPTITRSYRHEFKKGSKIAYVDDTEVEELALASNFSIGVIYYDADGGFLASLPPSDDELTYYFVFNAFINPDTGICDGCLLEIHLI